MKDKYKLLAGQTLSVIGTAVTERALPILLFAVSGNTSLAANVKAAATLPLLVLIPILGVWAESTQPRALVWLNMVFAIASVVLVAGVMTKSVGLITLALFVSLVVGGVFNPLYNKVLVTITPTPVESDIVAKQQTILSRLATALGEGSAPTLAAMFGGVVFLFDAGSFALSALIALTLPSTFAAAKAKALATSVEAGLLTQEQADAKADTSAITVASPQSRNVVGRLKQLGNDLLEGMLAIDKGLLALLLVAFAVWSAEGFVLPAFVPAQPVLGLLFVTKSVIETLTATIMLKTGWSYTNRILGIASVVLGLSSFVLASATTYGIPAAFAAMVLSGIGSNTIGVGVNKRLNYADPNVTARVSALVSVGQTVAGLLFMTLSTRVADATAPAVAFVTVGAIMTITTLLVFVLMPPQTEV